MTADKRIVDATLNYFFAILPETKFSASIYTLSSIQKILCYDQNLVKRIAQLCLVMRSVVDGRSECSKWVKQYCCACMDLVFSPVMFSEELLEHQSLHSEDGCVGEFLVHLLESASTRFGYVAVHMAKCLYRMRDLPHHLLIYQKYIWLIVKLLQFGPIRDLPEELLAEALSLENAVGVDVGTMEEDYMARAYMITLLNELKSSELADKLCIGLVEALAVTPKQAEKLRKTAFVNTHMQRVRLRSYQAMLVITPIISKSVFLESAESVWSYLSVEFLPSTRLFAEWFLICGFLRFPECIQQSLIPQLQQIDLPAGPLISSLCVLMHVSLGLNQRPFYKRALALMTPWFLHNSAAARLYTFYCFHRVAEKSGNLDLASETEMMSRMIRESEHCQKFVGKLQAEPMVHLFDPIALYSLEGIFYHVPRLTDAIAADEWISGRSFQRITPDFGSLLVRQTFSSKPKKKTVKAQSSKVALDTFQQKMNPLDTIDLYGFDARTAVEQTRSALPPDSSIIVIASLVDRVPNMAGLCRTAEVFGIEKLVLADLDVVPTKDFQTVCMTADKWVSLEQCDPFDLSTYLTNLRKQGYTIVALEQTSSSQSLEQFKAPKKFALLLGNESQGIPADLLHLCDVCVEIPQFGLVRSLNVNVAGSLILGYVRMEQLKARQQN